jgi:hypothetical protein
MTQFLLGLWYTFMFVLGYGGSGYLAGTFDVENTITVAFAFAAGYLISRISKI